MPSGHQASNEKRKASTKKKRKDLAVVMVMVGNGLLFHMTQPTSRSVIKAITCSKPIVSEH